MVLPIYHFCELVPTRLYWTDKLRHGGVSFQVLHVGSVPKEGFLAYVTLILEVMTTCVLIVMVNEVLLLREGLFASFTFKESLAFTLFKELLEVQNGLTMLVQGLHGSFQFFFWDPDIDLVPCLQVRLDLFRLDW